MRRLKRINTNSLVWYCNNVVWTIYLSNVPNCNSFLTLYLLTNTLINTLPLLGWQRWASLGLGWPLESYSGEQEYQPQRWWIKLQFHWGWCWHRAGKRQSFENIPSAPGRLWFHHNHSSSQYSLLSNTNVCSCLPCKGFYLRCARVKSTSPLHRAWQF